MKKLIILSCLICIIPFADIASKPKPTLFIIGDSTVKNGKGDGAGGQWGWGDLIGHYFNISKITLINKALGGTSSRSFITRGLWDEVLRQLKPGDYVLMQFGHNDGGPVNDTLRARGTIKGTGEETEEIDNLITKKHEVVHSYGWYIRKMVLEAKEKGAYPVVVTLIPRNDWKDGKIIRTPGSYRDWAITVAREEKVPYVDLNKSMSVKLDTYGQDKVTGLFFLSRDHTHTTGEGAQLAAKLIVESIKSLKKCRLRKFLGPEPEKEVFTRYFQK
jgi:lysophospholipase L1-like esterase